MVTTYVREFDTSPEGLSNITGVAIEPLGHRGSRVTYRARGLETVVDPNAHVTMFAIDSVFKDTSSVLIGCGTPNLAVTTYDNADQAWKRMNAFMFRRAESYVGDTSGDLQIGVYYELRGLPEEARTKLLETMHKYAGEKRITCARLNAEVLNEAGFTLGNGKKFTGVIRPSRLGSLMWEHGLKYDGKDVNIRVVNTSRNAVSDHMVEAWRREADSPGRAVRKQYEAHQPKVRRAPIPEMGTQGRVGGWSGPPVTVLINRPTWVGVWLGFLWGRHNQFSIRVPGFGRLPELRKPLPTYPGELDFVTRVKKYLLFSPPVIWLINNIKIRGYDQYNRVPFDAALEMMHPTPFTTDAELADTKRNDVWNAVVIDKGDWYEIRMTSIKNQDALSKSSATRGRIDWIMAKHLVLSGYDPKTVMANETWAGIDPNKRIVLCLNTESGTYQPGFERISAVAQWFRTNMGVDVEVYDRKSSPAPSDGATPGDEVEPVTTHHSLRPDVRVVREPGAVAETAEGRPASSGFDGGLGPL